jgi:hypothetical protein
VSTSPASIGPQSPTADEVSCLRSEGNIVWGRS